MPRAHRLCRFCSSVIMSRSIGEGWTDRQTLIKTCLARGSDSWRGHKPSNKPLEQVERDLIKKLGTPKS